MGSGDLQNWMHFGTMNRAIGAPSTVSASWRDINVPRRETGAPVHGEGRLVAPACLVEVQRRRKRSVGGGEVFVFILPLETRGSAEMLQTKDSVKIHPITSAA